jgi:insecticidal toxin
LDGAASTPGTLNWSLDTPENLLLSIIEEHLVIIDPDTDHCLIFRQVSSADITLRGEVFLVITGYGSFAISSLVDLLAGPFSDAGSVVLKELRPLLDNEIQ